MQTLIRWSWIFGLVGVVALLGALATWWVLDDLAGAPTWFLVGGAVSLILYAVLDRDRIDTTVRSRSFVYGSGSGLMVVMVTALAVAGYLLARDHDKTWDLTRSGDFTLSDHTRKVVAGLDEDVELLAFYRNESPDQRAFRDLARRLQEVSPRLKVQYVDPLRQPRLAEQHEVTSDHGVVVVRAGDRERRIESEPTEERLVTALVMVTSDSDHRICWSMGHGEPDPDDQYDQRGLGHIVGALDGLNYQVTKTFVGTTGIEPECEALIVARPLTDWFPYEREALAAYLAGGGRAFLLLEPDTVPELAAEMARYGVAVGDDIVLDLNPKNQLTGVQDPSFVVLTDDNIRPHPITRNLAAAIVLPISRSVSPNGPPPDGLSVVTLLRTSERAWGETAPDAPDVEPSEGELIGEVPVMAVVEIDDPAALDVAVPDAGRAAEDVAPSGGAPPIDVGDASRGVPAHYAPKAGGRLVIVGDADFANNVFLDWGNNRDLFLNTVAWLVDEEDQLGERPRGGDSLQMTQVGEAMLCLVSIFLVPGAAVFFAAVTLLRRRFL